MTDYECRTCEGLGELYVEGVYAGICANCNGGGYTNRDTEGEGD